MSNNETVELPSVLPTRVLFIDRDGTLIKEAPPTYQVDMWDKLEFYPHVFEFMNKIAGLNYELVMVSNQDGLGTPSFPENTFWPVHNFILKAFEDENVVFSDVLIDKTFPDEHAPTRKPGIGMFTRYLNNPQYDIANSFVIGDRITDMQLAKNLGCRGLWIKNHPELGAGEVKDDIVTLEKNIALETQTWKDIYLFLQTERTIIHDRNTSETSIHVEINLDGSGVSNISTGLGFFDHMLEQVARHGKLDITLTCKGDLHIDEHHTIEDTSIAFGEAILLALGNKKGIDRYAFVLPMDDCLAQVALDLGGRSWLVWDVEFTRERIGDMPTEMFHHFFKSFSDAAKCNLNIKAEGTNEHHKIESIFKAFAKCLKMAIKRDPDSNLIPSTKGII